ncbi:OprD family outer membrane porin, partial [Variovorax sp. 2RAF20]
THFDFGGVDYKFTDKITGSYHFAQLGEVYNQHFLGLVASQPFGPGTFGTDLRFAISDDEGAARGGKIDNKSLNGLVS